MQPMSSGNMDYGDLILEIDKLIIADRASLSCQASPASHGGGQSKHAQISCGVPGLGCQRDARPKPTIWQQQLPISIPDESPRSISGPGNQDMRQVRLFKTRFCSYGMDCPYMAKGKCLYAHSKDEIRLRPPPPVTYKLPKSRSVVSILKDDSQPARDSVWLLPESPASSYSQLEKPKGAAKSLPSLLECIASDVSRVRSVSSILGGPRLYTRLVASCEIEPKSVCRTLLEGHSQQVTVLSAVKEEIAAKIDQRRVALERWFPAELFGSSSESVRSIEENEREAGLARIRIEQLKRIIQRKKDDAEKRRMWLEACKNIPLPRRSIIVKSHNFQMESASSQLSAVSAELSSRRMTVLRELADLYPIEFHGKYRTIRDLALPNTSGLKRCELRDEESVSTALGYLVHRTHLAACIVDVPLKLILVPHGSRSVVKDRFSVPSLQEFPLYFRAVDRQRYLTGIHMLQDTLFHFNQYRTQKTESSNDLLELSEILIMRELLSSSF